MLDTLAEEANGEIAELSDDRPARGYAAIGLVGIKTRHNFGGAFRAAHCFGAAMIAVQSNRIRLSAADTTHATRHIPAFCGEDILALTPHDCQRVSIEIADDARDLVGFVHPERAFYIFGPEDGSVPRRILEASQHVVRIPSIYCLNLAAAVNVVLYDRAAKRGRARGAR